MSTVSVIIPSYNLGQYLPQTLKSVMDQTFEDWECLIVENGSTDASMNVVSDFCAADKRFVPVVFQENVGVAAARNRGLELAEGEYILFLDADDLLDPHYMDAAMAAFKLDPSLDVVYGKAERFGAETTWDLPLFSMDTMLASNCLYISCFFRRSAVMAGGDRPEPAMTGTEASVMPGVTGHLSVSFDPAFKTGYEDWDFWLTFFEQLDHEPRVLRLPSVCFYYRTRRHSRNHGISDEALADIRRALWEKHKALYAKYFCDPCQTVEYRRPQRSFQKASRWSLAWKLRMLYRKLFS